MKHFGRIIGLTLLAAIAAIVMTACGTKKAGPSTTSSKPIHVAASVDFYGQVAQAVLGDHGTVSSIINSPSVDPHDFEPTTKDGQTVSKANVVLANGIGYDNWMTKLAKSNGNGKQTVVKVGENVLDKHVGDNEHVWYQPATMPKLANYLADKFGKIAPKYKKDYQRNAQRYIKTLQPLQTEIDQLKAKSNGQKVDVSEPVFDYALDALGYQRNNHKFELAVENGTDPSPKEIRSMETDIKQHKIAFFVNNSQASDKTVSAMVALAKKNQVPVLNVTETLPKGKTYEAWMMDQYQALAKIQAQIHQ